MRYKITFVLLLLLPVSLLQANATENYKEAFSLYKTGEYTKIRKAVVLLESAYDEAPSNSQVAALLALSYAHIGYLENADALLRSAGAFARVAVQQTNSTAPIPLKAQASVLIFREKNDEAHIILDKVLTLDSKDAEALYYYAISSSGDLFDPTSDAGKRAQQAVELSPGFLWLREDMFFLALEKGDQEKAAEELKIISEYHPDYDLLPYLSLLLKIHAGEGVEAADLEGLNNSEHPVALKVRSVVGSVQEK